MRLSTCLTIALIVVSTQIGTAQSWLWAVDSFPEEIMYDVIELPDSSLFFTGGFGGPAASPGGRLVYGRLSSGGQLVWMKTEIGLQSNSRMVNSADRVFALASVPTWGGPSLDYLLIFDFDGNKLAEKIIGKITASQVDIALDADGSIYTAYVDSSTLGLIKLDPQLNVIWDITATTDINKDWQKTVRVLADGSIQMTSFVGSELKIMRFDTAGNQLSSFVASSHPNWPNEVIKAADEGYFLTRNLDLDTTYEFTVRKVDKEGNTIWENLLYLGHFLINPLFVELSNGNLLLVGTYDSDMAITFSPDGQVLSNQHFILTNQYAQWRYVLKPLRGGKAILGGHFSDDTGLPDQMYLTKWDSLPYNLNHWVTGHVFIDQNENCSFDSTEPKATNALIKATGSVGNFYSVPTSTGQYSLLLPDGEFIISTVSPSPYSSNCSAPVSVIFDSQTDSIQQDFGFKKLLDCPYLTTELTIPRLRRCFSNFASVHFCNLGTIPADPAHLDLTLDPWLELTAASEPFTALGGNVFRFELGEMAVFECRDIALTIKVDCDSTILGQTHCVEAHIFPDSSCLPPTALWSGASIEVDATCTNDTLRFFIQNTGSAPTSVPCDFIVIEDDVIMNVGQQSLGIGETVALEYPADGHFWRLEASQEPGHPGPSMPSVSVEGCNGWWPGSFGFWTAFPQDDGSPAVDIDCLQNIGSYDPNEKTAAPEGIDNQHFIQKNQDIEYTIHFQNTGTDTAFTVVVTDTIDQKLRPETLKLGGASHPFSWEIYGPGILKMSFEKINLPDSTTNLAGSQGWFSYRISQKPDLVDGSQIRNRAAIFFDFNPPILTNRTLHTIGSNFLTVKTWSPAQPNTQLSVFPNPTSDEATFLIKGDKIGDGDALVLQLFDVNGRLVLAKNFTKNSATISRDGLVSGLYFFKIKSGNGAAVGAGKLLIE